MQSVTSKVKPIPVGYHSITPILRVEGAPRLIDFLKQAFQAEERERFMAPDGRVSHAEVKIGDSVLMISDVDEKWKLMPGSLNLYTEDTDNVYRRALAAGATSLMEPADQFYGDRSAGVKDPFGNQWWFSTHVEDVSPDELQRRMKAFYEKQ
jgi:uncharacterized glyoxalase superfamily protein PhnB